MTRNKLHRQNTGKHHQSPCHANFHSILLNNNAAPINIMNIKIPTITTIVGYFKNMLLVSVLLANDFPVILERPYNKKNNTNKIDIDPKENIINTFPKPNLSAFSNRRVNSKSPCQYSSYSPFLYHRHNAMRSGCLLYPE